MKYLFYLSLLFIFEGLNAQTDSNNKEADLFYKDDNSNSNPQNNPVNKTNNTALQTKKYSFEKSNFSDFITNNKPIFLTGKSSKPIKNSDYYSDDNTQLCYNSIYEVENYSNELRKIPLTERDILYFSKVLVSTRALRSCNKLYSPKKVRLMYKKCLEPRLPFILRSCGSLANSSPILEIFQKNSWSEKSKKSALNGLVNSCNIS